MVVIAFYFIMLVLHCSFLSHNSFFFIILAMFSTLAWDMLEIPSGMSALMAIVEKGQKISLEPLQLHVHVSPMIIVIFQMPIRVRFLFMSPKRWSKGIMFQPCPSVYLTIPIRHHYVALTPLLRHLLAGLHIVKPESSLHNQLLLQFLAVKLKLHSSNTHIENVHIPLRKRKRIFW